MGHWRAVVHVQHEHGDDDAKCDEDHCKEQVLSNERDDQRSGGDCLGYNEQEHSEGEQDGDTERDLLSTVGWEIENQHCEERDEEAGDDEVNGVKEGQPPDVEGVGDVWVDLLTAVVLDIVLVARSVNDFPLSALPEVFQIHLEVKFQSCRDLTQDKTFTIGLQIVKFLFQTVQYIFGSWIVDLQFLSCN